MSAVQIDLDDLDPRAPLELRADDVEHLPAERVASLLRARFGAFMDRGCDWQLALWLAVRPGHPDASPWVPAGGHPDEDLLLQ